MERHQDRLPGPPGPPRIRMAVAALVAAVAAAAGAWAYHRAGGSTGDIVRDLAVGLAYAGGGLTAWWHRPANRTGPLMVAEGVSWFVGNLQGTGVPALFAFGAWWEALNMAVLVHLVVSFPDGRTGSAFARRLVVFSYGLVAVGGLLRALTYDPAVVALEATYLSCNDCGPNLLNVPALNGLFTPVDTVYRALGWLLSIVLVVVIVRRWQHASVARRRALLPAWIAIAIASAFLLWDLLLLFLPTPPTGTFQEVVFLLSDITQVAVPVAFLVGLLRMRLQRAEVGDLVIGLGSDPDQDELRAALGRVLGDPALRLGLWTEEKGAYVDGAGQTVRGEGPGRTRVDSSRGTPLALLQHDPALAEDPALLESVGAALRLALENVWLRTQAKEVTSRIVRAADAERGRLERDLHDGAQARLVFAMMALRRVDRGLVDHPDPSLRASLGEVERSLTLALEELRGIAHGIHPAVLTREGLGPALTALAQQAAVPVVVAAEPRRYDPVVESTAYFTVCETLANAAKHAHARAVSVSARHTGDRLVVETVDDGVGGADTALGSGLRGLADRLAAVDGILHVDSPAGGGTRIRAELPCA
ncbi:histidine kinase [Streptomyces sp. NBC_00237]|uniref:sensor histidine kinase n=1 Tax=Streptomyces sp. NBC_00237 TaxID=2975687 RepID=UPI0022508EDB|nr:histidine kinase [Streptomyces sp. NBC_00237]MCX5202837.1 histidine kinase [Streptomyces sp. NBC_00237]